MDKSTIIGKIPLVLITGFLGSGKTSLLRQILDNIPETQKVAIIQNEFAPGRVDSAQLESAGKEFNLLEINNGSVFCACLLDDFISRLGNFIEIYQPEVIFLEATGLADPVSMLQVLQSPLVKDHIYLGGIWTVIDNVNFGRSHKFIQRVRHQIQLADLIIMNKTDIQPPGPLLIDQIRQWNPHAELKNSVKGLFENLRNQLDKLDHNEVNPFKSDSWNGGVSQARPEIGSCVIRTQKTYSEEDLREFYNSFRGKIYRMKGFAKDPSGSCNLVQGIFDDLVIGPFDHWLGPTEIIIMGPGIEPGPLSRVFLKIGRHA